MATPSVRVACVRSGSPSAEQQAAYDWCERTFPHTERFPLAALADHERDLSAYDVCWWHTDEPIDSDDLAPYRAAFEAYLEAGGGLLLSLHALSAVSSLGIDPVAPDAVGVERPPEATGYLLKALHAEHPAFEGFDDYRFETTVGEARQPFARYERVVPERGDVLACAFREGDVPHEKTLLSWNDRAGTVLGAGASLAFDGGDPVEPGEEEHEHEHGHGDPGACEKNRSRLAEGLLRFLASDAEAPLTTRPESEEEFAAVRRALHSDPNRPTYHLTPPANWLNDPNGLIHWNGKYHVFYQYNPAGPFHGTIHWGHAVSSDLVRWEDRPTALSPSPDGPDRDGCWSGCTVVDADRPTIFYTGGRDRRQLPCRATATDISLDTWEKDVENPIIESPPEDLDLISSDHWEAEFRDHCIWREGETWYHLIGSGITDAGGTVLLYESPDLREWHFREPILTGDWEGAGHIWECPELLDLGSKRLLHVSNYDEVLYFLGHLGPEGFEREGDGSEERDGDDPDPREAGRLDHGDFYAPQSMRTDDGRLLTWGWVIEARPPQRQWDAGWSGALSLPRELSLSSAGDLEQRPARELEALRTDHVGLSDVRLTEESRALDVTGTAIEIAAEVSVENDAAFELAVRKSPDGEERTPIRYTGEEVIVDRECSSLDPEAAADAHRTRVENGAEGETLDLRVFLDGSIIEVFANDRRCLTSRIYPTRPDSVGLSIGAVKGSASVDGLDVWQLGGAWPAAQENESAVEGRDASRSSQSSR